MDALRPTAEGDRGSQTRYHCFMRELKRICVFCGSSFGARSAYRKAAEEVGTHLAEQGITVVYGGAKVGLMGVVADSALAAGGEVVGVIPESMVTREIAHTGLTELRIVKSMHERKATMAELSDGFIALPGGFGTFEEFCEVLTWSQLGLHRNPCGLLNIEGYYDALLRMFDTATEEQLLKVQNRALVLAHTEVDKLIELFRMWKPQVVQKWIAQSKT